MASLRHAPILIIALLATACATTPKLNTQGVDSTLTPNLPSEILGQSVGQRAHWGGVIISSRNQADESVVEVLAYPLGDSGRPNTDSAPQGRFLAVKQGYLETLDYSPGRIASFVGTLQPPRTGRVGDASYRYPVLRIDQSALWQANDYAKPQFHFGIGIGIHN